jgi:predicted ATPase
MPTTVAPHEGTERTPMFEPVDFGESEGERTVVTNNSFDVKARYTGRAGAITRLQELADKAYENRELGFVLIAAEPGLGKSRIVSELAARVRTQHPAAMVMNGIADENAPAYGPVARALTTRFGLVPGEDAAESRDKIQAGVADVMPASRVTETAHLIAHLLRCPFDDSPVVTPLLESPQRLEARLFMALKRLLAAEAERYPVLFVVENLELCGTDTINFLQYLAAGLRDQRVVIVTTATPALADRHPQFGEGEVAPTKIELSPLTPDESEELLRLLCKPLDDGKAVPQQIVTHVRSLGGSPRAIHELVRLLLESDVVVREGLMWRIDIVKLAATKLPRSYDDIVSARLRVMDTTERRVIEMAAVVGETSWLDGILALERGMSTRVSGSILPDPDGPTLAQIAASGDHSRLAVVAALGKLIEREWLTEVSLSSISGERELRFASPNLWSVVYKSIDDNRKRYLHQAVARWLELHPEGRGPAAQEEVARHSSRTSARSACSIAPSPASVTPISPRAFTCGTTSARSTS